MGLTTESSSITLVKKFMPRHEDGPLSVEKVVQLMMDTICTSRCHRKDECGHNSPFPDFVHIDCPLTVVVTIHSAYSYLQPSPGHAQWPQSLLFPYGCLPAGL